MVEEAGDKDRPAGESGGEYVDWLEDGEKVVSISWAGGWGGVGGGWLCSEWKKL